MILNVNISNSPYDIIIEKGSLNKVNHYIDIKQKVLILTDSGIPSTYVKTVQNQMEHSFLYTIEQGEHSKNFANFQKILTFMIENNFTRTDCVIALGGGVVGDLGGFVAASYMRGIDFYNIPTTLLAQVDSSIGGKTAIDHLGVKNIIGAFYQPKKVIIDVEVLKTLDKRILYSGLVEALKMATTFNEELFNLIANSKSLEDDVEKFIIEALKIKKMVVENDPKEKGLRKVLNFGHTIGHAIESLSQGRLYHGECVGIGMLYVCSKEVKAKIQCILEKYHLPTSVSFQKDELIHYIYHDKKVSGKKISIIYVDKIGHYIIKTILSDDFTAGLETIGIRIPDDPFVLELLKRVGPMLVTSANISGQETLLNDLDVYHEFNGKLKMIVKGKCQNTLASTVVKIDDDVTILRQGCISEEKIMEVLK